MKKTVVLLTIVLALLAAPVFADVSISGKAEFGVSSDFGDPRDLQDGQLGFQSKLKKLRLGVKGSVDEFTTVKFDVKYEKIAAKGGKPADVVPMFTVKSDVTGAFGLDIPVDVTLITGYNDEFGTECFTSGDAYELNDFVDQNSGEHWNIGADVKIVDMVTVRYGINAWVQEEKEYIRFLTLKHRF